MAIAINIPLQRNVLPESYPTEVYLQQNSKSMTSTAILGQDSIASRGEFEIIFRQYYEGLCRYAGMWIQDPDESEEIVQNTFVRLWEKRESLQIETSIKSYLYKSVYHSALNTIKHRKVKEQYLHMKGKEENYSEQDSKHSLKELESRIEKALEGLPEQCRLIFSMSRFQNLKYREIADILNISVKTVENQMGKALRLMRHNLADFLTVVLVIIHFLKN